MGSLKNLSDVSNNAHLLLTSSNLAEIYVYDALKARCNATLESIYEVNSLSTFKGMLELVNIQPNLADYWFFVIEYKKVKSSLKKVLGIFESTTSVFLIKVNTYKEFKEVKELGIKINDLYLENMKKLEVSDLLRSYNLSPKMVDFIATSYYNDPERIFVLYNEVKNGAVIENYKDIVKICGESTGSLQRFVINLLVDSPNTTRFLSRSYKKRVNVLYDLCDTLPPRTVYNYLRTIVKDILYIKMLYLEGNVYNSVRDLPECFDEKKLARYNYYLKTISEEICYNRILYLYNELGAYGRWDSVQDGVLFLYKYYLDLIDSKQ